MTEKISSAPSIPIDQSRLSDAERVLLKEGYVCILAFTLSDPDLDDLVLARARDRIDCHIHDKVAFFMQNEGGCRVWSLAVQDTIKPPPLDEDEEDGQHVHEHELEPAEGDILIPVAASVDASKVRRGNPQGAAIEAFVASNFPGSVPPVVRSNRPPPLPPTLADGRTTPSGPPSLAPSTHPPIGGGWQEPAVPADLAISDPDEKS